MTAAQELNRPDVWSALAKEAWRQGNHEIVELCYQHMHAFDHLAFLYVVTGDTEKLQKMMRIAELRQDVMNQFQTALFLGCLLYTSPSPRDWRSSRMPSSA